jgi:hypothetical protein
MFGAMGIKMGAELLTKLMSKESEQSGGGDQAKNSQQDEFAQLLKKMLG